MKTIFVIHRIFLLISACHGGVWDGLGVTWDPSILMFPTKLPRTTKEALADGWSEADYACSDSKGYSGYTWNNPKFYPTVSVLFDVNGYIAGIQGGVSSSDVSRLNLPIWNQMPPFAKDKLSNRLMITAYFIEPSKICDTGRTEAEYLTQGTGTNLYIENGFQVMPIPKKEKNLMSPWVKGECVLTLGQHYWYDITDDMMCDQFFPIVLMYNGGELNGFGFVVTGKLTNKYFFDINNDRMPLYMTKVPKCFQDIGHLSILNVFLDKDPSLNFC